MNKLWMISKVAALFMVAMLLPWQALAQVDPSFNANKLIEDSAFNDTQTFGGAAGIQKFLEVKSSVLANTSPEFLAKLKEPQDSNLKSSLEDPEPNLGRLRTAAELIWDASRQSGLNPQVILVTLNKEQSLITGMQNASGADLQKALDHAMGFDCPDSTGCGDLFPGFYYQLFGNFDSQNNRYLGAAKSLMKSFNSPTGRGPVSDTTGSTAHVGDTLNLQNTTGSVYNAPATSQVTLLNRATAALYRYTPHVFNGNYNFWQFFVAWFKYANGTLVKLSTDVNTYIIENGTKQLVPTFVAQARNLNLGSIITLSPTEFGNYPTDQVYGPTDNTIVLSPDSKTYVFLNNTPHLASSFVLKQRGLDPKTALNVTAADLALFTTGSVLPPKDGTVIKGQNASAVYLVQNGAIKLFSAFTFKQRKIAAKQIVSVPDDEVSTYQQNGFVPPLDGTLVKGATANTVYLVDNGLKRPLSAAVFKNRRFSFKTVASISDDEISALAIGAYATPRDNSYFKVSETGQFYLFKDGSKHSISSFVAKQKGITPDFSFSQAEAYEWLDGIAIPPRNGTLIKGDQSPAIYLVSNGQLRGLTAAAFKARRLSLKNVKTLPQDEVDNYAKGDVVQK